MKVFVFDSTLCNGCYGCQLACKDEHWNNEWPPYALSQPDTGHFWCRMTQTDHGQVPKVRVEYTPLFCNHCDHAPCIEAAPGAVYKRDDGLVIVDPVKAKGNRGLVDACPYGAIYYNEERDVPQKCTGCAHLVDEGELPHCVDLCATGALRFGEEEDFAAEIAQAETLADPAHGPRVYYLNRPHLFIGGEVWDPVADEVVEGARVTLSGAADRAAALRRVRRLLVQPARCRRLRDAHRSGRLRAGRAGGEAREEPQRGRLPARAPGRQRSRRAGAKARRP